MALDVQTPHGRREALVIDGVAREALAVIAQETVLDVHALPGPLTTDERATIGDALERSGLFRRLWE